MPIIAGKHAVILKVVFEPSGREGWALVVDDKVKALYEPAHDRADSHTVNRTNSPVEAARYNSEEDQRITKKLEEKYPELMRVMR